MYFSYVNDSTMF